MKVGLMWHGNRETRDTVGLEEHRLGPTARAFRAEGLEPVACVYNDEFAGEVREQLLRLDAVQIWVNPITDDGHDRTMLDAMLRNVADAGVFVSSHPDTIQRMGTKNVVYDTRDMSWGSDAHLIETADQLRAQLPERLAGGPRVLKQHRGHSGQGVWKLTASSAPGSVLVKPAARGTLEEEVPFDAWVESRGPYLAAGPMLDQEYNPRIVDGMVRCYLVRDRVQGFGHQEVNALVPGVDPGPRVYSPPDDARFQDLKNRLESEWVPQLLEKTGVTDDRLPMLWDTDFMFREGGGFMLCEINVSSVYPYPESAIQPLAKAFYHRLSQC